MGFMGFHICFSFKFDLWSAFGYRESERGNEEIGWRDILNPKPLKRSKKQLLSWNFHCSTVRCKQR